MDPCTYCGECGKVKCIKFSEYVLPFDEVNAILNRHQRSALITIVGPLVFFVKNGGKAEFKCGDVDETELSALMNSMSSRRRLFGPKLLRFISEGSEKLTKDNIAGALAHFLDWKPNDDVLKKKLAQAKKMFMTEPKTKNKVMKKKKAFDPSVEEKEISDDISSLDMVIHAKREARKPQKTRKIQKTRAKVEEKAVATFPPDVKAKFLVYSEPQEINFVFTSFDVRIPTKISVKVSYMDGRWRAVDTVGVSCEVGTTTLVLTPDRRLWFLHFVGMNLQFVEIPRDVFKASKAKEN
jgi:hypothetical protein